MTQFDPKGRKAQHWKGTHLKWDSLEANKSNKYSNLRMYGCVPVCLVCSAFPCRSRSKLVAQPQMCTYSISTFGFFFLFSDVYTNRVYLRLPLDFAQRHVQEKKEKNPYECALIVLVSLAAFSATTLCSHPAHFLPQTPLLSLSAFPQHLFSSLFPFPCQK